MVGLGRVWSTLEMDSGHKNKKIGYDPKSLRFFKGFYALSTIRCKRAEGATRALRKVAFGPLASLAMTANLNLFASLTRNYLTGNAS